MIKGLLFDFDGVIIDSEAIWYDIYKAYFYDNFKYTLEIEEYIMCVGSNTDNLLKKFQIKFKDRFDVETFQTYAMHAFIQRSKDLPLMPGVKALLEEAKANNIKIALATSATLKKPEYHLKRLGIYDYFDAFSTAELVENIKPAPDLFLKAQEMLKLEADECLVIEDSLNGYISATRANMKCLVVTNRITKYCDFKDCYIKVESLKDINLRMILEEKGESLC